MKLFFISFGWCIGTMIVVLSFLWLMCRAKARRCPNCKSKWKTELVGEWPTDDIEYVEDWHCHKCGQWFSVPNV